MIGKTISHYKILEKLGSGGMGVVYLAEDTKLERKVALKFLPPHLGQSEEEKRRFVHEAKAASALDHNNICTVFEIGDTDEGQLFIAMAYYAGETLKEKIELGPLKIEEAIDFASQIAQGLAKAHEKEIFHRDIKPANIMVTREGVVKIVDFGLAKAVGRTVLTKDNTTLGTVAYMSPEQAQGATIDHRTDIWALGAVLYEMITGRQPFLGDYEQAVMYSIMNEDPEPPTALRTGVPMELERIVLKALAKETGERYQHVEEMLVDLKTAQKTLESGISKTQATVAGAGLKSSAHTRPILIGGFSVLVLLLAAAVVYFMRSDSDGAAVTERKLIVVLPFENLGAAEDEYFADGITEEITSRLAVVSGLGVISRTSAIQYKNANKTIKQIGQELGVSHVLEGTIRWEKRDDGSSRVRVTPQLIRVADDTHLWANRYDDTLDKIFEVQSNIAKQIITQLNVTLLSAEAEAIESLPTENLEAYQAYLRGLEVVQKHQADEEEIRLTIDMFQRAIDLDPSFALAYARQSRWHMVLYWLFMDRSEHRRNLGKEAAEISLALQPDLPQGHLAQGYYYYYGYRDYENALKAFRKAQASIPNDSELLALLGYILRRQGRFEEAILHLQKAAKLSPKELLTRFSVPETYFVSRQHKKAIAAFEQLIAENPDYSLAYLLRALSVFALTGRADSLRILLNEMPGKDKQNYLPFRAFAAYLYGQYQEMYSLFSAMDTKAYNHPTFFYPRALGMGQALEKMSRRDEAHAYYQQALEVVKEEMKISANDHRLLSVLGYLHSKLGNKAEAIKHGKRAKELVPVSKDALLADWPILWLADIYAELGELAAATTEIELLLSFPNRRTPAELRNWRWLEPLWNYPPFEEVLKKYENAKAEN